jgi:predicted dehydrogenase
MIGIIRRMTNTQGNRIGIGLVGFGSIGKVQSDVLRSGLTVNSFHLVAVCDLLPKDIDNPFYTDYQAFLERSDMFAVSIATPTHYDLALQAIKTGKHVVIEKPPTLSLLQLYEIEQAGKEANVTVFTAYHACYRPEVEALRKELAGKQVRLVNVTYREDVLHYCDPNGWIFNPEIAGGGVFMSSGINPVSIIYDVLPKIDLKVTKVELETPNGFDVESKGVVEFVFSGGQGKLDMDWFHQGTETRLIEIRTNENVYIIDIVKGKLTKDGQVIAGDNNASRQTVDQHLEYEGVFKKFHDLIVAHESMVRKDELRFVLDIYANV